MARHRRGLTVFSMSFLDVMSCGFGAVVLIFLIINHSVTRKPQPENAATLAAVSQINREVTIGERDLAVLRQLMDDVELQLSETRQQADSVAREIDLTSVQLARLRSTRVSEDDAGRATRSFVGEGDRQYLTGIKVGGERIVIALDASASMLDDTLVNVIRRRNMSTERKLSAPKWVRAVRTVDWITSQIPLGSQFQVLTFNSEPRWLLPDKQGEWLDVAGGTNLEAAVRALEQVVPEGGTSLENVFSAIDAMRPPPDTVFLLTDSLPTMGRNPPRGGTVSGRDRLRLFSRAVRAAPTAPINVILFPMEGDPMAASSFWQLAQNSGGAFLSPARDWP